MEEFFTVLFEYVTIVELIWIVVMWSGFVRYGIGRYKKIYHGRLSYQREVPSHIEDSTKLTFDVRAFRFLIITLFFFIGLLIGIRSALTPNPPNTDEYSLDQILLLILLLSREFLIIFKGEYIERLEYKAYRKYMEEIEEKVNNGDDVKGMMMDCKGLKDG